MQFVLLFLFMGLFESHGNGYDQPVGTGEVIGVVKILEKQNTFSRRSRGTIFRSRYQASKQRINPPEINPLKQAVVYLKPKSFSIPVKPLSPAPELIQKDVAFSPAVLPITVGTKVAIVNNDKIYHNVFSKSRVSSFNIGKRPTGEVVYQSFNAPGVIQVFCNIHSNMSAHIIVLDTPFFLVPDDNGLISFDKLPAGEYELNVFHPDYNAEPQIIRVEGDKKTTVNINLK